MIEHLFYHLDLKFFLVNPNESKSCENIQYVFWNKHGVSSQCVTAPFRLQNWVWFPHSMFNTVENCYVPSMLIMFLFRIESFVCISEWFCNNSLINTWEKRLIFVWYIWSTGSKNLIIWTQAKLGESCQVPEIKGSSKPGVQTIKTLRAIKFKFLTNYSQSHQGSTWSFLQSN